LKESLIDVIVERSLNCFVLRNIMPDGQDRIHNGCPSRSGTF
jgi:hypothetical protein